MSTIRPVALTLFAVSALTAGISLPASAGTGGTCAAERACLFENNNFNDGNTQHWRDFAGDDSDLRNNYWKDINGADSNDHMDNEASSMKTNGCYVTLWQDVGFSGAHTSWSPGQSDVKLADNSIGDNRTSGVDVTC